MAQVNEMEREAKVLPASHQLDANLALEPSLSTNKSRKIPQHGNRVIHFNVGDLDVMKCLRKKGVIRLLFHGWETRGDWN